jgi:hypothetical protein
LRKVGGFFPNTLHNVSGFSLPPIKTDHHHITEKSIQEYKGLGCSKTFIHDGESYQLTTINAVYSKHAGKMTKFNYMEIFRKMSKYFQKVTCTSSMCP